MSTNKNIHEPEVNVGEALSKTEKFFETYKKHMIYGSIAIVAVVAAVLLAGAGIMEILEQYKAMLPQ